MPTLKPAALIALLVAGALAHGAGMRTHMEVAQRAVDKYCENAEQMLPGIEAFFADPLLRKAYYTGATFPDWGYPLEGMRDAAEASHWRPFLDTYAALLEERYPGPLEGDAARQFAFFLGVISHHISDTPWHFNENHPHGRRHAWERAYLDRFPEPTAGLRGMLGDEYTQDIFDQVDFPLEPMMTNRDFWWPREELLEAFHRSGHTEVTAERLEDGLKLREAAWVGERWLASLLMPYIVYKRAAPWVYENREHWEYGGYENCAAGIAVWNKYWFAHRQGWHYYQQQPHYAERIRNEGSYTAYRGVLDTTLCSDLPTHNGGQEPLLEAMRATDGSERSILLRFDLDGLRAGEAIAQASLWLRPVSLDAAPSRLQVHAMRGPWLEGDGLSDAVSGVAGIPSETGASWERSGLQPWAAPGAGVLPGDAAFEPVTRLELVPAPGGPWVRADVTALVQAWVNGTPNHGIILRVAESESGRVQFYSSQAWRVQEDGLGGGYRVAYRPTLIVMPEASPAGNRIAGLPAGPAAQSTQLAAMP